MFVHSVKITNKGQITIPKEVRNVLGSNIVSFEMMNGKVVINPVKSVAGILKEYSKDRGSFQEARNAAWETIVDDWQE